MAQPAKHLRVVEGAVDHESGELLPPTVENLQAEIASLNDELTGAIRALKGESRRLEELKRDKAAEARAHEAWPTILGLFDYWREQTGHRRTKWVPDKFWMAWPLWREYGTGNCAAGVAGIGYQPNKQRLDNGKVEVYDSWKLLFRDSVTLERYIKRRPADWILPARFELAVQAEKRR